MEDYQDLEYYKKKTKGYRLSTIILSVACLLLAIGLIFSRVHTHTLVVQNAKVDTQKEELKAELDSLLKEHDLIKNEYGNISKSLTIKDSTIQANAKEIMDLMAYKYDYNKVKRKLDKLRSFTQGYVRQIDSLLTVNTALRNENKEIRSNLDQEKGKNVTLAKEKEELVGKVTQAAYLKAYNIQAQGIRSRRGDKEDATEKARRTDKVKVCFTISENPLVEPGKKTVYVRITRPDNVVVTEGLSETTFVFNGQKIQYSLKQEIDYQNKAQNVCASWTKKDKKADAMKGVYKVAVFTDDYEIGQGQFELK